ncbi:MAG: hypothetical protein KDC53_04165 [Saprospiraceae bacterium]|nr:hypothetical protein [Saprospiraceae bacterium]
MKRTSLILSISVAIILGCKPQQNTEASVADDPTPVSSIPDDFRVFYDRFHQDTNYQIEHISFPLKGLPANADTLSNPDFYWQSASWKWHRPMDPNLSGYERQWSAVSDDMIMETIVQKASGIGMERRFAKMDDEWMLIYYAGMNPIR